MARTCVPIAAVFETACTQDSYPGPGLEPSSPRGWTGPTNQSTLEGMTSYYDPYPLLRLSRPVVLAGQIGCGARLVGRSLSARTGLPFAEVDRLIEHEAGRSLIRIAHEDGAAHIEHGALRVLERLATRPPFGLIVLDGAWPAGDSLPQLIEKMDFVHLQRAPAFLHERLLKERQRAGEWIVYGDSMPSAEPLDLEAVFARRRPLLDQAGTVLDAGLQHEHRMAEVLMDALGSIVDATAI